jgi:hypothetical protein
LRLLNGGLKQARLDAIERRAFLDEITLPEQHFFQITAHARLDLDAVDGLDPSDEVERFGNRLAFRGRCTDRNGGRCRLLRKGGRERGEDGDDPEKAISHDRLRS